MPKKKTGSAYQLLMDLTDELRRDSFERQIVAERYRKNSLDRTGTGHKTSTIAVEFFQMSNELGTLLTPTEIKFVALHLQFELKRYNLLWYFVPRNKRDLAVLTELRKKGVIYYTETSHIYIVNPTKVWRGTPASAVECTKQLLRDNGKKPSIDLVRDLRPAAEAVLETADDIFHKFDKQIEDIDHTEILRLEEPCIGYGK